MQDKIHICILSLKFNYHIVSVFQGHFGEATSLSISPNGEFLISCGQDRVLRLYEKSEEPVVLEDEREVEREKEDEQTLATGKDNISIGQTPLSIIPKKTVTSEKAVCVIDNFYFLFLLYLCTRRVN